MKIVTRVAAGLALATLALVGAAGTAGAAPAKAPGGVSWNHPHTTTWV